MVEILGSKKKKELLPERQVCSKGTRKVSSCKGDKEKVVQLNRRTEREKTLVARDKNQGSLGTLWKEFNPAGNIRGQKREEILDGRYNKREIRNHFKYRGFLNILENVKEGSRQVWSPEQQIKKGSKMTRMRPLSERAESILL